MTTSGRMRICRHTAAASKLRLKKPAKATKPRLLRTGSLDRSTTPCLSKDVFGLHLPSSSAHELGPHKHFVFWHVAPPRHLPQCRVKQVPPVSLRHAFAPFRWGAFTQTELIKQYPAWHTHAHPPPRPAPYSCLQSVAPRSALQERNWQVPCVTWLHTPCFKH